MVAAAAYVFGIVHCRAAVNPELLQRFIELIRIQPHSVRQRFFLSRLRPQLGENGLQQRDVQVVALEEKVVRAPIRIGMHKNRATGKSVAPGTADLLVVSLKTARQRCMNNSTDVRLVDAHALSLTLPLSG